MYRQLFSVVVFFLFIGQPCMGEASLRVGPYLQNFTPNSIVIMWETDKPCEGWVEYGSSTALGQKAEGVATCTHEIEIKGLEPATRYYYKVVWEGGESDTTWFKTAPPIGHRNFRFGAYGDSRSDFVTHSKIAQRIIEMDPAFVINSGDLVQRGQDYSQWKPQFFEPLQPLIKNVCIFTVLGNHEGNAPQYYQYLSLPKNGGNEAWWSTDIGNIHLVGLDSNAGYNATAPGSPQYEWLKNDLASTRQ
ncbi:MAG: metallophosphoesterase family protein, partial [Candidatus Omnitrophica bacterium]|nr:metallophosphoesterase family protein [Candidatus Omnitrophota bacterium]